MEKTYFPRQDWNQIDPNLMLHPMLVRGSDTGPDMSNPLYKFHCAIQLNKQEEVSYSCCKSSSYFIELFHVTFKDNLPYSQVLIIRYPYSLKHT